MNNIMQQIITEEVKRQYQTEKAFYENTLGITQQSWNRWKKGERGLKHEKMSLIKALFTPYEWMLVNKVASDMQSYPSNFQHEPFKTYINAKRAVARDWAERAKITVNSALNVDDTSIGRIQLGTEVKVSIDYDNGLANSADTLILYTDQSSAHIKAGKENRLKWFLENVDSLQ